MSRTIRLPRAREARNDGSNTPFMNTRKSTSAGRSHARSGVVVKDSRALDVGREQPREHEAGAERDPGQHAIRGERRARRQHGEQRAEHAEAHDRFARAKATARSRRSARARRRPAPCRAAGAESCTRRCRCRTTSPPSCEPSSTGARSRRCSANCARVADRIEVEPRVRDAVPERDVGRAPGHHHHRVGREPEQPARERPAIEAQRVGEQIGADRRARLRSRAGASSSAQRRQPERADASRAPARGGSRSAPIPRSPWRSPRCARRSTTRASRGASSIAYRNTASAQTHAGDTSSR